MSLFWKPQRKRCGTSIQGLGFRGNSPGFAAPAPVEATSSDPEAAAGSDAVGVAPAAVTSTAKVASSDPEAVEGSDAAGVFTAAVAFD